MLERLTHDGRFATTLWSVVIRAGGEDEAAAREALASLCERYWRPCYAFLRRRGMSPDDAADATQAFFAHLIEKELPSRVEPGKGKFRSYLLVALRRFVANAARVARADKRGGGRAPLSIEGADAERMYQLEPADDRTPEDAFARAWALEVIDRAFARLADELASRGQSDRFAAIRGQLLAGQDARSYAELATELDCSVGEVAKMLHRARARLRQAIRAQLIDTVDTPGALEEQVAALLEAL